MILTRAFFDPALVFLASLGLVTALITAWTVRGAYTLRKPDLGDAGQLFGSILVSAIAAYVITAQLQGTLAITALVLLTCLATRILLPRLTIAGSITMSLPLLFLLVSVPWTFLLLRELSFPIWMRALCLAGLLLSLAGFGFSFAGKLARQALFTHATWRRPTHPLIGSTSLERPMVSVQLACYSEPPELVMATMDRLARLDYPNFEVMICDNNTEDEALWRPLEQHCAHLNQRAGIERFRFFHVAPIAGAKAGALNFCLTQMAPEAELVAVIDADYLSRPDFLSRLVGFFENPAIGYVQTPHDYRSFEDSPYLRSCHWEYMPSNTVDMAGVSEYDAAFTIGTMCLIRTAALRQAGGWAEWCLTEDSEVSVRIRALGYEGVYIRETFGKGLIPERFDDYKKQRFRWTAGPVQQLRKHWRLFLPSLPGSTSTMGGWSKLLEVQRSVAPLQTLLGLIMSLGFGLIMAIAIATNSIPRFELPDVAWFSIITAAMAAAVAKWHRYRISGCTRIIDMLGGELGTSKNLWHLRA